MLITPPSTLRVINTIQHRSQVTGLHVHIPAAQPLLFSSPLSLCSMGTQTLNSSQPPRDKDSWIDSLSINPFYLPTFKQVVYYNNLALNERILTGPQQLFPLINFNSSICSEEVFFSLLHRHQTSVGSIIAFYIKHWMIRGAPIWRELNIN